MKTGNYNRLPPLTVWKRFNGESQKWDHNHIESGHVGTMSDQYLKPLGDSEQNKNWSKGTWLHEHRYIESGKVI